MGIKYCPAVCSPRPPRPPPPLQEYEERLARLRADYEAEQESRARLEEDITAMRNSYDVKLSTLEESLRKETGGRLLSSSFYSLTCIEHFRCTRSSSIYSSLQPSDVGTTITLIL